MVNYFDLSGKIAVVTGGSRGLGRQIALAFADHGADIVVAGRKIANCEQVAEEVRAKGRRALAIALTQPTGPRWTRWSTGSARNGGGSTFSSTMRGNRLRSRLTM